MDNLHQEMILLIKQYSPQKTYDRIGFGLKYVGTNKPSYHLNTKDTHTIAKLFLKSHALSLTDFHKLILSLYQGETYDEINLGAKIIQFSTQHKKEIDLIILDQCLDFVHGWAEVDTLCQMAFNPQDTVDRWPDWEKFISKLNHAPNIQKRRASLVLLTKVVGKTTSIHARNLAVNNIKNVLGEKDILITKAISWLLRSLIANHRSNLEKFLGEISSSLPNFVVKEVRAKLLTGKKCGTLGTSAKRCFIRVNPRHPRSKELFSTVLDAGLDALPL